MILRRFAVATIKLLFLVPVILCCCSIIQAVNHRRNHPMLNRFEIHILVDDDDDAGAADDAVLPVFPVDFVGSSSVLPHLVVTVMIQLVGLNRGYLII